MNFYQMDVYEIERYMRNNSIGISDIMQSLIDQLKEVSHKYGQLTEVLERLGYRTDPIYLEEGLELIEDQLNELKENVDNLKHEISYLKNDIETLKIDF